MVFEDNTNNFEPRVIATRDYGRVEELIDRLTMRTWFGNGAGKGRFAALLQGG
jgi:hypothetical protein